MTKDTRAKDWQALEHLLDVCGADRTRWPARERLRFASFIAEDQEAQRLVAECAALDALLDRASAAGEDREHALKDRIVAAALRSSEPKLAAVAAGEDDAAPHRAAWLAFPRRGTMSIKAREQREWPAAALLAASLVLGVMLGTTGTLDSTMQEVAEATGIAASAEPSQLALGEEFFAPSDEDLL